MSENETKKPPTTNLPQMETEKVREELLSRVISNHKPPAISDREARLRRFVHAYKRNGGDAIQAVIEAGDPLGGPLRVRKKNYLEYISGVLLEKAKKKGLIESAEGKKYPKIKERMEEDILLDLLTKQASGERPTYRQEVLRRNPDTGLMEVSEVRSTFDEVKSQEILAKILGLYDEVPKAPNINIGVMLDGLKGLEKEKAEAILVEAHTRMLEAQPEAQEASKEQDETL